MVPAREEKNVSQLDYGNAEGKERRWGRGQEGESSHEMGTSLASSWSVNRRARVELFTAGSATMENLPMYLERGGSAKRSSMSSYDH
jgi:hypothetical protein